MAETGDAEPKKKTKRIQLKAGDVFEMRLADGRLAYGVVIATAFVPYVIVLRSLHEQRPPVEALHSDDIALVGWTTDALIYHGVWTIAFRDYPERKDVPYPNWKVHFGTRRVEVTDFAGNSLGPATAEEAELLDYQTSRSPIGFQHAIEALHGLQSWDASYDKLTAAYLLARTTRPLSTSVEAAVGRRKLS